MTEAEATLRSPSMRTPVRRGRACRRGRASSASAPALALGRRRGAARRAEAARSASPPTPAAAILTAISDGKTLLTGGDDGRVVAIGADGATREIADEKGRWIDALAHARARPSPGARASRCAPATTPAPSRAGRRRRRVRGLAFQPKGFRLAATHYNGASLWFPKVEARRRPSNGRARISTSTFSPDGRFLVTSMQENALHGWRLADSRNMRMTGYPAKTRSLSWSHDGAWLATSGADACVVWPFKDKDGPMGKAPRECGVRQPRVTQVAFHPKALVVAIGYADGLILLCRLADGAEILVRQPGDGAVSALAWDATGARLAFGLESGAAGLLTLPA